MLSFSWIGGSRSLPEDARPDRTPGGEKNAKLREIERLRGLAALMVVFTHLGGVLTVTVLLGHPRTGVDLFFVISGLVVTRSLLRLLPDLSAASGVDVAFDQSRFALRVFYTRRFFRIVPAAVASMVLQLWLFALGAPESVTCGSLAQYWREVFAVFCGFYNYAQPGESWTQFGVFWSLAVEEHFYLLLPLCFLFARTRARRLAFVIGGIAFVALVSRSFFDTPPAGTANVEFYRLFASHLRFDQLLAGVALALVLTGPPSAPVMPKWLMRWILLPACLALLGAIPRVFPETSYFHQGITAAGFLCAIVVAYASFDRGYVLDFPLLGRALEHLGARSYALYLLHFPLYRYEQLVRLHWPAFDQYCAQHPRTECGILFVYFLMAIEISWHVLEAPMQRLGRRLT